MAASGNGTAGNVPGEEHVAVQHLQPQSKIYDRLVSLGAFYKQQYGTEPEFYVRVPGRVNLIGEHVDYCGYSVLPMAVEQSIILAIGANPEQTQLQLRHLDGKKFQTFDCDLNALEIKLPKVGGPAWYNYFICGVKGIQEELGAKWRETGIRVALSGNVPLAAGLSSSSALVSAAVLATAHVQSMSLDRKLLASISASCEQYIGTHSGGMDQAIAYLAKKGYAQHIEFHPKLNATPVMLPAGCCFVVANSCVHKNKAASSDYNERVVECRLATRWLAKSQKLPNWQDFMRFKDLEEECQLDNAAYEQLVLQQLKQSLYTRDDICEALGITEQQLETDFLTPSTQHMQQFKLRQRALHVIQESGRVLKFRQICEQLQRRPSKEDVKQLGKLMQQSHHSLRELYECSHPDLERLVALSTKQGVSARVTGAGWGGCIVAMCESMEAAEEYVKVLEA
ncbi:N-acetylgalactosamine kinase [Drosophila busckii]|uniref:N-acetylgalactosamine kinase n=1 Tax=Drosophila busckii TaxID=30019 RepID=UPI001432D803|nr:N-acetylgalactosamine kinase [Drosophila busckii]XP_017840580.2 N-acetylgalactosamine kinase [Drosophila busckii]XP_017840581.2 N-acetylgalactosamine kinase [Drosophila busckii]